MTSCKGYNLCHVFVLISLCSFQVQCSIFSWADLKDMMRQAGEVTYTDAHQRMVSTNQVFLDGSMTENFRVKTEAKSVLLTEMRFMLPKRNLMVKNVTVSFIGNFRSANLWIISYLRSKVGSKNY